MRFFRIQQKGISFKEMKNFNSLGGGPDGDGYTEGLAVSGNPEGYDGGSRFGGAWEAMDDDDEVIILEGCIVAKIYDGYRIRPTKEIARFTKKEWAEMLENEEAWDYE